MLVVKCNTKEFLLLRRQEPSDWDFKSWERMWLETLGFQGHQKYFRCSGRIMVPVWNLFGCCVSHRILTSLPVALDDGDRDLARDLLVVIEGRVEKLGTNFATVCVMSKCVTEGQRFRLVMWRDVVEARPSGHKINTDTRSAKLLFCVASELTNWLTN